MLALVLLLAGCAEQAPDRSEPVGQSLDDVVWVDTDPIAGSATSWQVDLDNGLSRETVEVGEGATTDMVDLLWVIDDSVSMGRVLDQVYAGLDSVLDSGEALPRRLRMAVMYMSPGDGTGKPHPAARQRRSGPGFLFPVDSVCRPWFRVGERAEDGTPCLEAHTELRLVNRRVEAGLTALGQALERAERRKVPLFRTGAAANVVFVSDTHDPGFSVHRDKPRRQRWFDELVSMRPDYAELAELAHRTHELAGFRLHAIAPDTECSGERWMAQIGPVYHDAAEASGGVAADVCTETDYAAVVADILASAPRRSTQVVALEDLDGASIVEVRLDGRPVDYRLDGGVLELAPGERGQLEVLRRFDQAVWE